MIIGIIALTTLLNALLLILLHRGMARALQDGLLALDYKIANAISKIAEEIMSGEINVPEINPVQAMLFDLFKNAMEQKKPNIELLRDNEGKFSKSNSGKSGSSKFPDIGN